MEEKNEKKLTYEQLEAYAALLSLQLQQLYKKCDEMYMANLFKRLDYLFKTLEHRECFSIEFVENCVKEITEIMTPAKQEEDESE